MRKLAANLLSVDLTAVHMLLRLFRIFGRFELDVAVAAAEMRMLSIHRHFARLQRAVHGKYFDEMFLGDITRQITNADAFRRWRSFSFAYRRR